MKHKFLIFILIILCSFTLPACTNLEVPPNTSAAESVSGNLEIHFIDVGQGDSTLILCNGESLLIDGGNVGDSSLIYSYLEKHKVNHINYMVGTHVHEDHIGGLSGALNYAKVDTVFCPVENYNTRAFQNWLLQLKKQNVNITIPNIGDKFKVGEAQCEIIGVNTVDSSNPNNSSIVIKMIFGETSFLFSGDAEQVVESAILNEGTNIKSTVLKVPHHGSDTSLSYRWLRDANPDYAIISCGKDNKYGHPNEATLSKLKDAEVKTFRTDLQGDIVCTCDGKSLDFRVAKNIDINTLQAGNPKILQNSSDYTNQDVPQNTESFSENTDNTSNLIDTNSNTYDCHYILNVNTKKFHLPTCPDISRIKEKNKGYSSATREALLQEGYSPCQKCKP